MLKFFIRLGIALLVENWSEKQRLTIRDGGPIRMDRSNDIIVFTHWDTTHWDTSKWYTTHWDNTALPKLVVEDWGEPWKKVG